jgi:N-acetyl-anhydromuramyl-L-alanine amidase AmpD
VLLAAFQRHWRPARVDGALDAGTLARLRRALLRTRPRG